MRALISLRNWLLQRLVPKTQRSPLNAGTAPGKLAQPGEFVAGQLRSLLEAARYKDNRLDYAAVQASAAYQDLQAEIAGLNKLRHEQLGGRTQQMAFWINLYNLLTLHAVIARRVRRSVAERFYGLGFFSSAAYRVGGLRFSLDDIEHGLLRGNRGHPYLPGPQFAPGDARLAWLVEPLEVRIHFALNCASASCPPVGVYQSARLDEQLEAATRHYLNQEITLNPSGNGLRLPMILKWYQDDFGGREAMLAFTARYLGDGPAKKLLSESGLSTPIKYKPYDWSLNGVPTHFGSREIGPPREGWKRAG